MVEASYLRKFYKQLARDMIVQAVTDIRKTPSLKPKSNLYLRDVQAFVNDRDWLEDICEIAELDYREVHKKLTDLLLDAKYNPTKKPLRPIFYDPTEEIRGIANEYARKQRKRRRGKTRKRSASSRNSSGRR